MCQSNSVSISSVFIPVVCWCYCSWVKTSSSALPASYPAYPPTLLPHIVVNSGREVSGEEGSATSGSQLHTPTWPLELAGHHHFGISHIPPPGAERRCYMRWVAVLKSCPLPTNCHWLLLSLPILHQASPEDYQPARRGEHVTGEGGRPGQRG